MSVLIEGIVAEKSRGTLVLMTAGVGWQLSCSMNTMSAAPAVGESMRCYTYLSVREDALELFGFATPDEKQAFLTLTGISGVGPKTALGILGTLSPDELNRAVLLEDVASICRAPGIGKKTAQRIVMEMRDKVSPGTVMTASRTAGGQSKPAGGDAVMEAMEALTALGYTGSEARDVLIRVQGQTDDVQELIRLALRAMAGA